MADLIDRQATIDAILSKPAWHGSDGSYYHTDDIRDAVNQLPSAKPERKTGKWVKMFGYATPGGDPVWCCSECGKGVHVYGVEHNSYSRDISEHQWVACPNCGALMDGEKWD